MKSDDEVELLRTRIADLESVLRQSSGRDLALAFQLPPVMEKLLGLLLVVPRVTSDMIQNRLEISSQPKISIFRLRRHMEQYGVEIRSARHIGYWIEQADKEHLLALAGVKPNPAGNAAEPHHPAA